MLREFSSVNFYRIALIELPSYGLLLRQITFMLWNHKNMP